MHLEEQANTISSLEEEKKSLVTAAERLKQIEIREFCRCIR